MTRKRFIKLLMAAGYSRNQSNVIAKYSARPYTVYNVLSVHKQLTSATCYRRKNYRYKNDS